MSVSFTPGPARPSAWLPAQAGAFGPRDGGAAVRGILVQDARRAIGLLAWLVAIALLLGWAAGRFAEQGQPPAAYVPTGAKTQSAAPTPAAGPDAAQQRALPTK